VVANVEVPHSRHDHHPKQQHDAEGNRDLHLERVLVKWQWQLRAENAVKKQFFSKS
jgi:hypothetical protein